MTKVLKIDASGRVDGSVSRALSEKIAQRVANGGEIITRDLANALPHLDQTWIGATFTPVDDRTAEQHAALSLSDELVAEIQAAETIVIGTPIYNFGVPAALKSWIDQIARAGVTFKYTESGPVGLLTGKRAIIAVASGGVPLGSEMDHATPLIKTVLGFVGITDVQIIDATGTNADLDGVMAKASDAITKLAA